MYLREFRNYNQDQTCILLVPRGWITTCWWKCLPGFLSLVKYKCLHSLSMGSARPKHPSASACMSHCHVWIVTFYNTPASDMHHIPWNNNKSAWHMPAHVNFTPACHTWLHSCHPLHDTLASMTHEPAQYQSNINLKLCLSTMENRSWIDPFNIIILIEVQIVHIILPNIIVLMASEYIKLENIKFWYTKICLALLQTITIVRVDAIVPYAVQQN